MPIFLRFKFLRLVTGQLVALTLTYRLFRLIGKSPPLTVRSWRTLSGQWHTRLTFQLTKLVTPAFPGRLLPFIKLTFKLLNPQFASLLVLVKSQRRRRSPLLTPLRRLSFIGKWRWVVLVEGPFVGGFGYTPRSLRCRGKVLFHPPDDVVFSVTGPSPGILL